MMDREQDIVHDATKGEASAFGLLYDHYQPQIYRFIVLKVGRREEAEDLTHQVFLSAWQNIRSYKQLGHPFSSWLYQIARNQIIDHYRTRKPDVDLEEISEVAMVGPEAEIAAEERLQLEAVMRGMRRLKPEYQDIILLRFVEELSVRETAEAIKKSEGAVKLLQHRAVKQLKEILSKDGIE